VSSRYSERSPSLFSSLKVSPPRELCPSEHYQAEKHRLVMLCRDFRQTTRSRHSQRQRVLTYLTSACHPEKMRLQRARPREQMVLGHHLAEPRAPHPSPTTPKSRRSHKPQRIHPNHYNCFCLARPYLSSSHTVLFWACLSCCLPHTILFKLQKLTKTTPRMQTTTTAELPTPGLNTGQNCDMLPLVRCPPQQ